MTGYWDGYDDYQPDDYPWRSDGRDYQDGWRQAEYEHEERQAARRAEARRMEEERIAYNRAAEYEHERQCYEHGLDAYYQAMHRDWLADCFAEAREAWPAGGEVTP